MRHPTWHEWDITLSRRFPISLAGRRNSGIRLQLQAYNVFNETQFTNMNAAFTFTGPNNSQINSANTGKYTATGTGLAAGTIAPRVLGLTARVDWSERQLIGEGPGSTDSGPFFSYSRQLPTPNSQTRVVRPSWVKAAATSRGGPLSPN